MNHLENINSQTQKLLDLVIKGVVSEEDYKQKLEELKTEEKEIQKKVNSLAKEDPEITFELLEEIKNTAVDLAFMYENGDDKVREDLLKSLLSNCLVSNQKISQVSWNLPWSILRNAPKNNDIEKWSERRGSNPRPTHWQCVVLAN